MSSTIKLLELGVEESSRNEEVDEFGIYLEGKTNSLAPRIEIKR